MLWFIFVISLQGLYLKYSIRAHKPFEIIKSTVMKAEMLGIPEHQYLWISKDDTVEDWLW